MLFLFRRGKRGGVGESVSFYGVASLFFSFLFLLRKKSKLWFLSGLSLSLPLPSTLSETLVLCVGCCYPCWKILGGCQKKERDRSSFFIGTFFFSQTLSVFSLSL